MPEPDYRRAGTIEDGNGRGAACCALFWDSLFSGHDDIMLTLARPWGWRCSQNSGQIPGLARGADLEKARCSQYNTHHHLPVGVL